MLNRKIRISIPLVLLFISLGLALRIPTSSKAYAQQPTGSIPTVTGTTTGMIVRVNFDLEVISVYSGPSSYLYPAIGVLLKGQEVSAYGISEDGNWIQVYYPGVPESVAWVYGPYVTIIKTGRLPELQSPDTPTPVSTPTLDPTLEAAFVAPVTPTRLPTFTPPPPLAVATFLPDADAVGRFPIGLLIVAFGFIGIFGTLISFLRGQ